eukprot:5865289-Amphidinium_carterae.2
MTPTAFKCLSVHSKSLCRAVMVLHGQGCPSATMWHPMYSGEGCGMGVPRRPWFIIASSIAKVGNTAEYGT